MSDKTTQELIAETKRLDEAASDGPWMLAEDDPEMMPNTVLDADEKYLCDVDPWGSHGKPDAQLIAAYRTLAPELARRLEEAAELLIECQESWMTPELRERVTRVVGEKA